MLVFIKPSKKMEPTEDWLANGINMDCLPPVGTHVEFNDDLIGVVEKIDLVIIADNPQADIIEIAYYAVHLRG